MPRIANVPKLSIDQFNKMHSRSAGIGTKTLTLSTDTIGQAQEEKKRQESVKSWKSKIYSYRDDTGRHMAYVIHSVKKG